ncbi:MAG: hypothetical protein H6839_00060 [Planctomycetes bacterium]|nr:hypothetical protein [Planctomycetota bacterium]
MRRVNTTLAVLLLLALARHDTAEAADSQQLAWHCPALTALRFERKSPAPKSLQGPKFADDLILLRAHLSDAGEVTAADLGAFSEGDFMLRVACVVPEKAPGKVRSWKAAFDNSQNPRALAAIPDKVSAEYTFTASKDGVASYHVSATGDDGDAETVPGNPAVGPLTIEADATFDVAKGWLTSVKGTWKYKAFTGEVEIAFDYQLAGSKTFADRAEMNKEVEKAIEAGLKSVDESDSYWSHRADFASLAAYTYLHGGRPMTDAKTAEALSKMVKESSTLPFIQMYHAGALALAIESKYIGDAERKLVAEGKSPSEFKRALTTADRELMKKIVDWIASKVDEKQPGLLSYGQSEGQQVDLSNTQFAALALAAASRCGVEIPPGLVRDMGNNVTGFQQEDGPEVWRVKGRKKNGKWEYERYTTKARGCSYHVTPGNPPRPGAPTGSMTGAGVCTMLLMLDIYEAFDADRRKQEMGATEAKEWSRRLEDAANSGIAWLQANYTVARNPGIAYGDDNNYYYLYALERVGAFAPTEYIGEHSWYEDGALALLLRQGTNGGWGGFEDTCFALLFLSRATTPTRRVLTGK